MDGSVALLWIGAALAAGAIGLLRFAWGLPKRSAALNGAGWSLLLAALAAGTTGAGAWGMALVAMVTMAGAFLCLAYAGLTARPGKVAASTRRVHMLPQGREPLRLGGRVLTFLLTVPGAMIIALLVSLAIRAVSHGTSGNAGIGAANANVLLLFLMPILWGVLAMLLLLWPDRRRQVALLAGPGLAGWATLWLMRGAL